ncbi:MAG: redoxin domain-containing protein [Pirellulaceae bacterium]
MDRTPPAFCKRPLTHLVLLFGVIVFGGLAAPSIVMAESPSPKAALSLEPVQENVVFEKVAPADVAKCNVRDIDHPTWTGWEVVAGDGTMLRRFADTNKDKKIDLWSYYNFGIEVYRDVDADFNGKADQYQWLGTSGTRWGLDENEDGSIDRWQRISVEEVSAEVVAAVRDADTKRFSRMLATERELQSIGLSKEKADSLAEKSARAANDFARLAERQKSVGPDAKWVQFASSTPGVVPAGTNGSTKDVVVYENAVAMFEQGDKSGQLLVGTIVRVGDAWRLVDLPSVGAEGEGVAQGTGHFFTPASAAMVAAGGPSGVGQATQELVIQLEKIDAALTAVTPDTKPSAIAKLHDQRADVVESLIETAGTQEEKETWVRQLVDTVTVAVQSGTYPDGLDRLQKVAKQFCRGNEGLSAYADFQSIGTEYVTRQTKDADFPKVQEWYLKTLNDFIDRYPKTPETAQATLQLALSKEFEDKEREALRYYRRVASDFANTDAGRKAKGAVRRLESVGQRIEFEGSTIDGKPFALSKLRGKPVVIHYWATWCEPCKQDMVMLRRLQARYKDLELVGVNVDTSRELAAGFLKENSLPWIQLYEDGGLESSPLSNEFGVQTLPTMMLIDQSGKVVRHNIRVAELDGELETMTKPKS